MGSEWREVLIEEICAQKKGAIAIGPFGSRMKSECYVQSGVPVIRGTNIGGSRSLEGDFVYVTPEFAKELGSANVYLNDLVFPHRGAIGQVGIVAKGSFEHYVISSSLMKLSIDQAQASPDYIFYFFRSDRGIHELLKHASTVGTPGIGQPLSSLRSIKIPLPPLSEQKAIAHILGSLDDKIELNRKQNATLEAMAQALFQSWFVDFDPVIDKALAAGNEIPEPLQSRAARRAALGNRRKLLPAEIADLFPDRFVETEEMGWVPEGWGVVPFGSLLSSTIGGDWGLDAPDDKHTEKVMIIRGADFPEIRTGGIGKTPTRWVESKKLRTRQLFEGDIVIEISGGSPTSPTGRSIFITQNILDRLGGIVEPASFCRLFRPTSKEIGVFAAMHLTFIYGIGKMWQYQNTSTGLSNFQTSTFLETEFVPLPEKASLLKQFYGIVLPILAQASKNETVTLTQLRDTLLPKLISGEIRVGDVENLIS